MTFNQRITRIEGLSDRRRLPRLGSIRLGIKVKTTKGTEYPKEVEWFVCPPEVQAVFGEKPTELDIMLPINDIDSVFPQSLKFYGSSKGLKCHGNMRIAYCYDADKKDWTERECPCENLDSGKCKQSGSLMVMIPKVSVGGIYQIRTSSYNSIVDINSGIDYVSALLGRFALVPLTLRRVKTETHHDEKKQYHYTLQIIFDADINTLNALRGDTQRVLEHPRYQLPAPVEENPEMDPTDVIIDEEDEDAAPEKTPAETTVKPEDAAETKETATSENQGPQPKRKHTWTDNQRKGFFKQCGVEGLDESESADFREYLIKRYHKKKYVPGESIITEEMMNGVEKYFDTYLNDWKAYRIG